VEGAYVGRHKVDSQIQRERLRLKDMRRLLGEQVDSILDSTVSAHILGVGVEVHTLMESVATIQELSLSVNDVLITLCPARVSHSSALRKSMRLTPPRAQ
jgi:hypothetical protein